MFVFSQSTFHCFASFFKLFWFYLNILILFDTIIKLLLFLQVEVKKGKETVTVYKRITESMEDLTHDCGDIIIVEVI